MDGPLRSLLDSAIVGTYLRFRIALLFALALAVVLGGSAVSAGGLAGVALLVVPVACGLFVLLVAVAVR